MSYDNEDNNIINSISINFNPIEKINKINNNELYDDELELLKITQIINNVQCYNCCYPIEYFINRCWY